MRKVGDEDHVHFDVIIGNPPYQEETIGDQKSYAPPIYDKFMEAAYSVGDMVELITPARFLFDAGATPKEWNRKRLNDPYFKVLDRTANSAEVFPNTDIKGGVAITMRNSKKKGKPVGTYVDNPIYNRILHRVIDTDDFSNIISIIFLQNKYDLPALYSEYPQCKDIIGSDGKDKRLRTNAFSKLPMVFTMDKQNADDIEIYGLTNNKREKRYIARAFIDMSHDNINKYKVLVPKSNGSGSIGEVLSTPILGTPILGTPVLGYTQSFIGIGAFDTQEEAEACMKYIKSKFCRVMLGTKKITQDNQPPVWSNVPLQDFTADSDIDWTKTIPEIDEQLYDKYDLTQEERDFIETNVKPME